MRPSRPVAILGSTGSIGRNVLHVINELIDGYEITGLAAGQNLDELALQTARFRPQIVSITDERRVGEFIERLKSFRVSPLPDVHWGAEGIRAVANSVGSFNKEGHTAQDKPPIVVAAMVGVAGLRATYESVRCGCTIALANKETLVAAGELVMRAAEASGAEILPIDSEPNAIHQCLRAGQSWEIERMILTASGGPFRQLSRPELQHVTLADALRHPTWNMGRRITVDSATLVNKGFEIIEACHLFNVRESQVGVLIHPQSIVHSMVEFRDGSVLAQMGVPDMRTPIQYVLTYPDRVASNRRTLRLDEVGQLDFELPDDERFPALRLAREAFRAGGGCPAVFNAADETAVSAFCSGEIGFPSILEVVNDVLDELGSIPASTLEEILAVDADARRRAAAAAQRRATRTHAMLSPGA